MPRACRARSYLKSGKTLAGPGRGSGPAGPGLALPLDLADLADCTDLAGVCVREADYRLDRFDRLYRFGWCV